MSSSPYTETVANLTLAGARAALDAAIAHATGRGDAVDISVCDRAGHEIVFARMDGAPVLSMSIARDKAYTVAAFGPDTRDWWDMIKDEDALREGIVKTDRLQIFGGGVAIQVDGVTVGAVGVSGSTSEGDHEIAAAGAAAVSA
ncbi:MAG: GlcG/HbpS family heme-binding protein [Actinomycetales bacterium]